MTVDKPVKPTKANEINDNTDDTDGVEKPKAKVAIDFDEIIADELGEVEDKQFKVFRFNGREWNGAPRIGVGTIRKLVRAEARGDQFATIGFLASVVDDPDWEDVVDRMDPSIAAKLITNLLAMYSGDSGSGK